MDGTRRRRTHSSASDSNSGSLSGSESVELKEDHRGSVVEQLLIEGEDIDPSSILSMRPLHHIHPTGL